MLYPPTIHIHWDGRGMINVEPVPSKIPTQFIEASQRFAFEFQDRIERLRGEAMLANEFPLPIKRAAADSRGIAEHAAGVRLPLVFRWAEPREGICECGHERGCHSESYRDCRPMCYRRRLNEPPAECQCREFKQAPDAERFELSR